MPSGSSAVRGSIRAPRFTVGAGVAAVLALVLCVSIAGASAPTPPARGSLTTYGYGSARSGHDRVDGRVGTLSSIPAWDDTLDAAVYQQPLVYDGVVYVGTEGDTLYALDAKSGAILWDLHVGNPIRKVVDDLAPTLGPNCGDVDPIGIISTPVIDPTTDMLYLSEVAYVGKAIWQDVRHRLVAVSLRAHRAVWIRDVDPPGANSHSTYFIPAEQQRSALTLLGSRLYVEFGGLDGGCGKYHGYVVSAPDTGSGPMLTYEVPTLKGGGIWGTAGAAVSRGGDLFVATGTGTSASGAYAGADSILELSPALKVLGRWAPRNWSKLEKRGFDLGATSPIPVPDSSYVFAAGAGGGQASTGDLLRAAPLRGIGRGAFVARVCSSGGAFGADASDVIGKGKTARVYLYVPCSGGTVALLVNTKDLSFTRAWTPSTGTPNGPPIVAGGLVWALDWNNALLYGMSPTTGHVVVRRATDNQMHFATPALGDGMLFIPTEQGVQAWSTVP